MAVATYPPASTDFADPAPTSISSPLGPAWLSLLGKTTSGGMDSSAQATNGLDRNQPRVKMEGFEMSPPPMSHKASAPTPQDILARYNSQGSNRSPSIPNANGSDHGHLSKSPQGLAFPHSFGQDSLGQGRQQFGNTPNFGSFQPFRPPYGSQAASTFEADLFALTSGVNGVGMGFDDASGQGNGMHAYHGMNLNAHDMAGNGQFAFGQHVSAPTAGFYGPGFKGVPGMEGRSVPDMINFPGSPISTQGFSSQSTGSLMTGSSMPHSFPLPQHFGPSRSDGPPTSSGGHSGDGMIDEDHSLSGGDFTDSPRMDGPRPRKMSKSGTGQEDVTTRSPTWPMQGMHIQAPPTPAHIRRASVAERPATSARSGWSAASKGPAGMSDALRRSSTGQSSSVRPAFSMDGSVTTLDSSASRQNSNGFDRFLMPSRQGPSSGTSASRSPNTQHSASASDKSPLRKIEQVDEEMPTGAAGTSALDDDPSPLSGEFVDFSGNQPTGKPWPRPGSGDDAVDDADDDSLSVLQAVTASDNAEARRSRRRLSHNEVERRRREVINEKIQELETLLPPQMVANAIAVRDAGDIAEEDEDGAAATGKKCKSSKKKTKKPPVVPERLCKGTILCLTVELVKSMNAVMDHRDARDRELQHTIEQLRMQLKSHGIEPQYPPGAPYGSDIYAGSHGDSEALRSLDDLHKHIAGTARMSYVKTGSQARSQSRGRKRSSSQLGTVEEVQMHEPNGGGYFGQY